MQEGLIMTGTNRSSNPASCQDKASRSRVNKVCIPTVYSSGSLFKGVLFKLPLLLLLLCGPTVKAKLSNKKKEFKSWTRCTLFLFYHHGVLHKYRHRLENVHVSRCAGIPHVDSDCSVELFWFRQFVFPPLSSFGCC